MTVLQGHFPAPPPYRRVYLDNRRVRRFGPGWYGSAELGVLLRWDREVLRLEIKVPGWEWALVVHLR